MGNILNLNKKDFSREIKECADQNSCTFIESILILCEKYGIEPESVSKLITKPIKDKLASEGRDLNIIPKTAKLEGI